MTTSIREVIPNSKDWLTVSDFTMDDPSSSPFPLTLIDLPIEILSIICRNLCLHCQHPDFVVDLPDTVVDAAREDKRSLARLSRTCRALRPVAQPVLFHYYHSGNQPLLSEAGKWDRSRFDQGADNDLLLHFLRTIINRPDLAASVRAVSLFTALRARVSTPEMFALLCETGRKLGVRKAVGSPFPVAWYQEVAVAVTSASTQQLLINRVAGWGFYYLKGFDGDMPRLRYIALTGLGEEWYRDYHLGEARPLIRRAPNLEVLVAADCGAESDRDVLEFWSCQPWDVPLPNLRRLSVNGLDTAYLASLVARCPALEDLECHVDVDEHPLLSAVQLAPLRPTLRRLCYSVTNRSMQTPEWKAKNSADHTADVLSTFLEPADAEDGGQQPDTYVSLADFTLLEILEIEQILLYGAAAFAEEERAERFGREATSGPATLAAKLPPSLRVLHVGMAVAWPELRRDLVGLVAGGGGRGHLERLRVVRVDCLEVPPEEEVRGLEDAMRAVGVEFSVGCTPVSLFARGMLGDRPGHPVKAQEPSVLFSL